MKYCLCEAPAHEHDMTRHLPVGFRVSRLATLNSALQGVLAFVKADIRRYAEDKQNGLKAAIGHHLTEQPNANRAKVSFEPRADRSNDALPSGQPIVRRKKSVLAESMFRSG